MIEFNGHISGSAAKYFTQKSVKLAQNLLLFATLLFAPTIIIVGIRAKNWLLIGLYCMLLMMIPLIVRIPKSKKERIALTPKRIYVEEESIVCVADKYVESRLINDVILVRDFGEFYEIVFPFGKISDKFICQKDLLIKGSIEEFESLFDGKLTRQTKNSKKKLIE